MSDERLTLEIAIVEGVALVKCTGRITAAERHILQAEVSPLIPNYKRVVLDFSALEHMDSMGVGSVVRLYVSGKASGCSVELYNLGPRIKHILGVSNLLSVFGSVAEHGMKIM